MAESKLAATVRPAGPFANVIDIQGEINSLSEQVLSDAFALAGQGHVRTILFNFTGMEYMNSFGIGMLVTLLIRARRENKKIVGYGLTEHYCRIFELTRLDQAIPLFSTEETALASAERYDLPERES